MQTRGSEQQTIRESTRIATIKSKQNQKRKEKENLNKKKGRNNEIKKKRITYKIGDYEKLIAEAIFSQKTKENEYVSYHKINKYLHDYKETGSQHIITKRTKYFLGKLLNKNIIKSKKDSYAFTKLGLEIFSPEISARKKLEGGNIQIPNQIETQQRKYFTTLSGRISRQVIFD